MWRTVRLLASEGVYVLREYCESQGWSYAEAPLAVLRAGMGAPQSSTRNGVGWYIKQHMGIVALKSNRKVDTDKFVKP